MKLLVTGGAGFIGSHFILYWMKNHSLDKVINIDKLTYAGNIANLLGVQENPNYSFICGDICDPQVVDDAMKGVDIVVHFAAETHVDRSIMDPYPFIHSNIVGTYVLLEAAKKHKVKRFHHISTDEVFGSINLEDNSQFNEETKYDPSSPYSATKAGSDHLVRAYYHTYGLPVTISNCSNNFGPAMYPEKLIPIVITNLLENKKIPLHGDGKNVRDWLYVEDHVRAIELILEKGKIGETYLVGGMHKGISNLEVVRKILKLMGKSESCIHFVNDRQGNDKKYDVDWSKINKELGWKPLHNFDEWLEKTIQWYAENKEWWKKIKEEDYSDILRNNLGGNVDQL
ncbi:MAG: dTDP-glucose 4,6-dehydratase [Candidatus Levybacteria bacterium CG22_combo_CG10-13_8_21_14_all_35_11]|nr:MAG: dTDP-glucose 4,6-dehydratase [Candidatus Levybacteria bacterium CG22_combo_CG10-13_8_21_14_all_35_11]